MKQVEQSMPTANIAINKSRIKVYNKKSDMPTYYLKKGQEFQIELFNPTSDIILAKISLNNKSIAQGGLVLKPGQRVFLDRYIDVAKKFKFDTYEVANTQEVKEAIKDNGDFKVEFYREQIYRPLLHLSNPTRRTYFSGEYNQPIFGDTSTANGRFNLDGGITTTSLNASDSTKIGASHEGEATMDWLDFEPEVKQSPLRGAGGQGFGKSRKRTKKSKSIETGRVEMGSTSEQKLETVHYNFEIYSFHTITYKMLPTSQKVNTVQDVNAKRYCTECGTKPNKTHRFCNQCGAKL